MNYRTTLLAAALMGLSPFAFAAGGIPMALNQVGIAGTIQGVANHLGQTTGGIGVRASYFTNGILATASYGHQFGSSFSQETGGYSNTFNLRGAYLMPMANNFAVGPYLGYSFENLGYSHGGNSFSNSGNYLGGGLYAAYSPMPRLTVTGYAGYLASISTHFNIAYAGQTLASGGNGNQNLFQTGLTAYYRVSGPLYAYTGFSYARTGYTDTALNALQGTVGIGYHF